tara:strand:+ start:402 stop:689 length:288 start_codon:yes stop_codon:yes gene_type:complete
MDDKPTFRYLLDRLGDVKTQSDLEDVKCEIETFLPLDRFEQSQDFDVNSAIFNVKRDYVERALVKSDTLYEASELLGLKSYQVLVNWMKKLGLSK